LRGNGFDHGFEAGMFAYGTAHGAFYLSLSFRAALLRFEMIETIFFGSR